MGTPIILEPEIPGVTVECDREHPKPEDLYDRSIKKMLAITVRGRQCHVIQFCARTLYLGDEKRYDSKIDWPNNFYSTSYSSGPKKLQFHLDAARSSGNPYYEEGGLHTETENSLTIYDMPTIGSGDMGGRGEARFLGTKGTENTFVARTYCIADGGLLGIVEWRRTKLYTGEGRHRSPSRYSAISLRATNKMVDWGRDLLKAAGFPLAERYLPYQRINLPQGT